MTYQAFLKGDHSEVGEDVAVQQQAFQNIPKHARNIDDEFSCWFLIS